MRTPEAEAVQTHKPRGSLPVFTGHRRLSRSGIAPGAELQAVEIMAESSLLARLILLHVGSLPDRQAAQYD
jgi:hypothetical protein